MNAKPLWGPIETPDGVWIPGPHGVSGESEIYGGISGGVGIIESGGEAILTDVGYRTTPEYPPGVLDTAFIEQRHELLAHLDRDSLEVLLKDQRVCAGTCADIEEWPVEALFEPLDQFATVVEIERLDRVF